MRARSRPPPRTPSTFLIMAKLKRPRTEFELHDWVRDLADDVADHRRGHEALWWQNIATFTGDLWAEYSPHERKLIDVAAPDHRVRLPINLANPVIRTEYAKLVKNRPIVDCVARSNDRSDLNAADVGDKILNSYVEKQFKMARVRRRALWWTLMTGSGAIFTDYDDMALGKVDVLVDPTGTPIFDPKMVQAIQRHYRQKKKAPKTIQIPQGELRMKALGPFQFGWDMATYDFEDAWWCLVTEVYDIYDVERRWGVLPEGGEDVKPNVIEQRMLAKADLTKMLDFKSISAQEVVRLHRVFIRPGHHWFPQGAEIVFTEAELIAALEYPFSHGRLPLGTMGHIPFHASRYGLSVLSQISDPVLELSKTQSQLLENRNLMGNPPWLLYEEHGIEEDDLQNKPGLQLRIKWRPQIPEPHPIDMPEMPAYIQNLPEVLRSFILEISGQGETSQGRVPPGARSGVAIAYLQEEDDTKLGPTVQEFEEMIEEVAWQQLQVIAEKYDAPRTIQIPKRHSEPEVFDFIGTMLTGVTGVNVQAGSALPRSNAAKQQFTLDLYSMGIITDPMEVKDRLELGEGEPPDYMVAIQQAQRENAKLMQGQFVNVEHWYNHPAHHMIHRRYMMSADFEALSPQAQQAFKDHDQLHTQVEEANAMEAAKMAMMTGGAPVGPAQNGAASGLPGPNMANGTPTSAPAVPGPNGEQLETGPIDYQPQ